MAMPDINFYQIREHNGSRHKAFEELCCQLAALEPLPSGAEHYRKGPGADAGVECFTRFPNGKETGWQVKYYSDVDNLISSLNGSIEQALIKHPKLSTYIVCIPFDFSDARTGKAATPWEKWSKWRSKWQEQAKLEGRMLHIDLWSASILRERLTRDGPEYAGRTLYWFNEQILTQGWFRQKFEAVEIDLGSRYTAETNIDLPIRQALLGFARDPGLHLRIEDWAREISRQGRSTILALGGLSTDTSQVPKALGEALAKLQSLLPTQPIIPTEQFPVEEWREALNEVQGTLDQALDWCFQNIFPPDQKLKEQRERVRFHLWELHSKLSRVLSDLEGPLWGYVNVHKLLIHGDGGIGKSHLLADVTAHQIYRGRPAVLLLGQKFLLSDPWEQITRELNLPVGISAEHFLGALDAAAEAAGVRALILIDALNERNGKDLWPERLGSFLHRAKAFPHVGIVLSCRTTYLPYVIPEKLTNNILPRLHHIGFGSSDARAYLNVRGIILPGAPIPTPEFSNPLFLKSCCDALINDGLREFPRGVAGATAIFSFYREAISRQIDRRLNLEPRRNTVKRAVDTLAQAMAEGNTEYLSVERVQSLFDAILPYNGSQDRDLLAQLESEGMLTVEVTSRDDGSLEEAVRFTFQRFSDHVIAARLIDGYVNEADPAAAFAPCGPLNPYISDPLVWEMAGVVEAFAVQLPERFGIELPALVPENNRYSVTSPFQASLLWRAQQSFTKITLDLVRELLGDWQVLETLLHIATDPDNVFNVRYLHSRLLSWPMPERDAKWSIEIAERGMNEDSPIWTLIDWAWDSGFDVIEDRRAELAGITLCWFLTTSSRVVRDRATKALAALLAKRPILAIELLACFWEVDDDYLRERLLAAIYGAVLQGLMERQDITDLVRAVYTTVFANGQPPVNALIRDHSRCIVEYAVWRECVPTDVDLSKARPPYQSAQPLEFIPDETIKKFTETYQSGSRFSTRIVSSTVSDGDFARYVIDGYVKHWSPAPLGCAELPTDRDVHLSWLTDFDATGSAEAQSAFSEMIRRAEPLKEQGSWEKTPERTAYDEAEAAFRATLSMDAFEDFRVRIQGWIKHGLYEVRHISPAEFDQNWARRWVCKRAHDLGWSEELHGAFDRGRAVSRDRTSHGIERIGKKYQWLALYEIGARLADNYAFIGEYPRSKKPATYNGENFGSLRDLDPSLLIRKTHDDGWRRFTDPTWWAPVMPQLGPSTTAERLQWLYSEDDMIDGVKCIDVVDRRNHRWMVLHNFLSAREWSREDHGLERDTWARINCIIITKSSLNSLLRKIKLADLDCHNGLPFIKFYGSQSYIGEYPWHWSLAELQDWFKAGRGGSGLPTKARPTVAEYVCERSGYDYSVEETVHVEMPAPWLIRALGLRMSDGRHATFIDGLNKTKFFDPALAEVGPHASLIDRNAFLAALDAEDLAPIWIVAGEKGVYGEHHNQGFGGRHYFTSLYWLENGKWQHRTHRDLELPSKEQVEKLFGGPAPVWVKTSVRGHLDD